MSRTTVADSNRLEIWAKKFYIEYVREHGFAAYMGKGGNSIIQTKRELIGGGKVLTIPLLGALKGYGMGTGTLEGNEEAGEDASHEARPVWCRHAVECDKDEEHESAYALAQANKDRLKVWYMDNMRDHVIDALLSLGNDAAAINKTLGIGQTRPLVASTRATAATTAEQNAWLTANVNRALFGALEANTVAGDMAASLANVDSAADKLSMAILRKAKTMARKRDKATGRRAIRPIKVNGNREYFTVFVETNGFNFLKEDDYIVKANRDARQRGLDNHPIFQDGDLIVEGMTIREVPELPVVSGAGASSIDVSPAILCGAQAMCYGVGQEFKPTKKSADDYGFVKGVGGEEKRAIEKMFYNGEQWGCLNIFTAAE